MDLKVLKSFITVCETGNITRASERLFISQPALTRQIKDLEEEVGSILFDRSTRALSLTESGHLFYAKAQEILGLVNSAKKSLLREAIFWEGRSRSELLRPHSWSSSLKKWRLLEKRIRTFCLNFIRLTVMTSKISRREHIRHCFPSRTCWNRKIRSDGSSRKRTLGLGRQR